MFPMRPDQRMVIANDRRQRLLLEAEDRRQARVTRRLRRAAPTDVDRTTSRFAKGSR